MNSLALSGAIGALLALSLTAAPAQAQLARTFVSQAGADTNDCNRFTPCRTFQRAHDQLLLPDGGEITVLDAGGYGSVTINRNTGIINDGVGEAGILVSGGNTGVTINTTGVAVTLRGITIRGIGFGGGDGVLFTAGKALSLENCLISNLTGSGHGNGVLFTPNDAAAMQVTNSLITDNFGNGILVAPTGTANASAVIDHSGFYNNSFTGVQAFGANASSGRILVTINESVASNNGVTGSGAGFLTNSATGKAQAIILLNRSVASTNPSTGVLAFGTNAFIDVNQSGVFGNANGWSGTSGGMIFSYGNNAVLDNAANEGPQSPLSFK